MRLQVIFYMHQGLIRWSCEYIIESTFSYHTFTSVIYKTIYLLKVLSSVKHTTITCVITTVKIHLNLSNPVVTYLSMTHENISYDNITERQFRNNPPDRWILCFESKITICLLCKIVWFISFRVHNWKIYTLTFCHTFSFPLYYQISVSSFLFIFWRLSGHKI